MFQSRQNYTTPATDTVPAGTTVRWVLVPYDYSDHSVTSVGTPAFAGGGDFANDGTLAITFSAPGTYRYQDGYTGATGTVVVR
jgi:plastocyanin